MYLVIAAVENHLYYYGPYPTRQAAQAVIDAAEERKGDRAPDMRIRNLQPSDAFLVGQAARTYCPES